MSTLDNLLIQLESGNPTDRWQAVEQLAQFPEDRSVQALLAMLKHPDASTRWRAAQSLSYVGGAEVIEPLAALLEDEKLAVRQWAARALVKRGDLRSIEKILETHQGIELLRLGNEINPGVVPFLTHSDWKYRFVAARVLLFNDWQAANKTEKIQHAIAMREWDEVYKFGVVAIPFVEERLGDDFWEIRLCAAKLLCRRNQVRGMEVLLDSAFADNTSPTDTLAQKIAQRIIRIGDTTPQHYTESQRVLLKLSGSNLPDYEPLPQKTVISLVAKLLHDPAYQKRAITILEHINTPESLQVLADWRK